MLEELSPSVKRDLLMSAVKEDDWFDVDDLLLVVLLCNRCFKRTRSRRLTLCKRRPSCSSANCCNVR